MFTSSVDPNKMGKTVEGAILAASTIIVFLAHQAGLDVVDSQVSMAAVDIGSVVSTLVILFGLIRKLLVTFTQPKAQEVAPSVQVVDVKPEV